MKEQELFFTNLLKKKCLQEMVPGEISWEYSDSSIKFEETENEWAQEYALIYQSYSREMN